MRKHIALFFLYSLSICRLFSQDLFEQKVNMIEKTKHNANCLQNSKKSIEANYLDKKHNTWNLASKKESDVLKLLLRHKWHIISCKDTRMLLSKIVMAAKSEKVKVENDKGKFYINQCECLFEDKYLYQKEHWDRPIAVFSFKLDKTFSMKSYLVTHSDNINSITGTYALESNRLMISYRDKRGEEIIHTYKILRATDKKIRLGKIR